MRQTNLLGFLPKLWRATVALIPVVGLAAILSGPLGQGFTGRAVAQQMCDSDGIPIWVTVEKVRSSSGTIKVELYNGESKKALKKRDKIARTRVKAQQGETSLCLSAPSEGEYAIALYHDENDNKKFDRNFMGIPREGFGFSNNPPIGLGLPEQKEVRFRVDRMATSLRISVVYL